MFLSGCTYVYDNVTDRESENYQGFTTVATVDEVSAEYPVEDSTIMWAEFRASQVADGKVDVYALQIAESVEDFSSPVYEDQASDTNIFYPSLSEGTWYYRVRAHETGGEWGEWSTSVIFSATSGIVSEMEMTNPSSLTSTRDRTPLFEWAYSTDDEAAEYEIALASSEENLSPGTVYTTRSSEYQTEETDAFAYGDTCWWRVRAIDENGVPGIWSESFHCTVELLEMITAAGGTFLMGSNSGDEDESPPHNVTVTGFSISKYEVTQGLYEDVMDSNPAQGYGEGDDFPVYFVDWYDAVNFCNTLSDLEGLERCYTVNGTDVTCDFVRNGYRLPTEAEWEFAARGGNSSGGFLYAGSDSPGTVAWYDDNDEWRDDMSREVGGKAPNELGIHDMSGNLREWCWDWYSEFYYSGSPGVDPTGPASGQFKVFRGGWAGSDIYNLRTVDRAANWPEYQDGASYYHMGFRVVKRE